MSDNDIIHFMNRANSKNQLRSHPQKQYEYFSRITMPGSVSRMAFFFSLKPQSILAVNHRTPKNISFIETNNHGGIMSEEEIGQVVIEQQDVSDLQLNNNDVLICEKCGWIYDAQMSRCHHCHVEIGGFGNER